MSPPPPASLTPEQQARVLIDAALAQAGWVVQNRDDMDLSAGRGVAVREFKLTSGHGYADYLLFVDAKAVGVLEAKPVGHPLSGVEGQAVRYAKGLPSNLDPPVTPLPFLYLSTGAVTTFTNLLDPHPRSREIFGVHRPEALAEQLQATPDATGRPSTLRRRLQTMPPLERAGLFANQVKAVVSLEQSLKEDRPRSLIQMATGSGKTIMAITAVYRLIKHGGARRVLFLVDRGNLGEQAEKEFQGYRTPDDNRKFTELYNVQRLTSNTIGASSKVVISTIQRLYSILKGEPELPPGADDQSLFETTPAAREPLPVVYNETYPPEYFDVIVVDECHRSIYSLWSQVLEYFDAYLIGLTATPAKHTFGFFKQNLVMEYPHELAVAEGVNVDFEIYRIRTKITEAGSIIAAAEAPVVGYRSRATRQLRWQSLDDDLAYGAGDLDRAVVAKDQIRLIARTFRARLFKDIFPGRTEVPKTLVFAKDDSHAEDIVQVLREEFGLGNDFCQKITYKTTGTKPADLIQAFRTSYWPRIAVTVDMIATGTDIRAVEIVMFMRSVQSRVLFEQMKGRGVRVIQPDELRAVTPDAKAKTHFVIVDCVGITESTLVDTQPLEKKKGVALKSLLEHVAAGGTDPEVLTSLASRLARLQKQCGPKEQERIEEASGGVSLAEISEDLVEAVDPDHIDAEARRTFSVPSGQEPTPDQLNKTAATVGREAAKVLATKPALRTTIQEIKRELEQVIDEVSKDELLEAGMSEAAKEKAKALVTCFEQFIADNKDEITALQFFYSMPHARRLHFKDVKTLVETIKAPPRSWTPEALWRAYEILERDRVRGASGQRMLTDIVSLVRFALHRDDELRPYPEQVRERFTNWLAQQANGGRQFTAPQVHWLEMIRDHVATSLEIDVEDFEYTPFAEEGGWGKAAQVFGEGLPKIIAELNEVLVA